MDRGRESCKATACNQHTVVYLSVVVKVSELSLPADKRIWIAHGEAELKPHHGKL